MQNFMGRLGDIVAASQSPARLSQNEDGGRPTAAHEAEAEKMGEDQLIDRIQQRSGGPDADLWSDFSTRSSNAARASAVNNR
jgi:hypothetical protein